MAQILLTRPSIMTRDHGILAGILQDAKNGYIEAQKDKITIFVSDRYNRYSVIRIKVRIRLLNTSRWQC